MVAHKERSQREKASCRLFTSEWKCVKITAAHIQYIYILTIPTCVQKGSRHRENRQAALICPFLLFILLFQLVCRTIGPYYLHAICVFKREVPTFVWFQRGRELPHPGHHCQVSLPSRRLGRLGSKRAFAKCCSVFPFQIYQSYLINSFVVFVPTEEKNTPLAPVGGGRGGATLHFSVFLCWCRCPDVSARRNFPLVPFVKCSQSSAPPPTPPTSQSCNFLSV